VARVLPRLQVTTLHQCREERRLADRVVEDVFEEMVELFEIFLWHMSTVHQHEAALAPSVSVSSVSQALSFSKSRQR
jgi:hypothetical protein